jgi:hypothetical protein
MFPCACNTPREGLFVVIKWLIQADGTVSVLLPPLKVIKAFLNSNQFELHSREAVPTNDMSEQLPEYLVLVGPGCNEPASDSRLSSING